MPEPRKRYEIKAEWDAEAGVWWCSNDELPLTTEAPTFEQLVSRVLEIAPEIAAENGLAMPGDEIELHVVAERLQSVPVIAGGLNAGDVRSRATTAVTARGLHLCSGRQGKSRNLV